MKAKTISKKKPSTDKVSIKKISEKKKKVRKKIKINENCAGLKTEKESSKLYIITNHSGQRYPMIEMVP